MKPNRKKVIAVLGTTASGKTGVGVFLASALGSCVVSADSQLVYQELDIGTAKPTEDEMQGIPHSMIDVVSPTEAFTVERYQKEAYACLEECWNKETIPVVAGGSGFYFRALLQESFVPPVPPNPEIRDTLKSFVDAHGSDALYQRLLKSDPRRAGQLHPNDVVRVIRALEIIEITGKPVPDKREAKDELDVLWLGLSYQDRDKQRQRIDERIDVMMDAGWVEEVRTLKEKYGASAHALQVAHGYPELLNYLEGSMTWDEALAQIQINVHQYARRQMTFHRPNKSIDWHWVDETPLEGAYLTKLLETVQCWADSVD